MKVKKMKKTLVASIMTVVLCVAALVGTTMAWFTDTVSVSADIKAGTFSIALKKYDASSDSYVEIGKKATDGTYNTDDNGLVEEGVLWKPNKLELYYLAVENLGNLEMKYDFSILFGGDAIDAMEYAIIKNAKYNTETGTGSLDGIAGNWDALEARASMTGKLTSAAPEVEIAAGKVLAAPDGTDEGTEYMAFVLHMDEAATSAYQNKNFTVQGELNAYQVDFVELDPFADYTIERKWDFAGLTSITTYDYDGMLNWSYSKAETAGRINLIQETDNNMAMRLSKAAAASGNAGNFQIDFQESGQNNGQLTGLNQYVSDTENPVYQFSVKLNNDSSSMLVIMKNQKAASGKTGEAGLVQIVENKLYANTGTGNTGAQIGTLQVGTWYRISIEYNRATDELNYYIDNTLAATYPLPASVQCTNAADETIRVLRFQGCPTNGGLAGTDYQSYGVDILIDNIAVLTPPAP